MSEGIVIAIIGLIGTISGALIGAFVDIQVAKINSPKSKSKSRQTRSSNRKLIFIVVAAGLGLICSVSFAATQLSGLARGLAQSSSQAIDLGSGWRVSDSRPTEKGAETVYAHYPAGKIKYTKVNPDDSLTKVFQVCGFSRTNIFNYFKLEFGFSEMTDYESSAISVSNGCYIEFTVRDVIGDKIGIELDAEPAP